MKLALDDIKNLRSLMSTVIGLGIDAIVINEGIVSGANPEKSCVIISNANVPKFSQKIGLARIGALRQRLDLFKDTDALVIDAVESDKGEIRSLDISAGRNKVQFRCQSTALIKSPKVINDDYIMHIFLSKDELKMLMNASKVMGAKKVQLTIRKDLSVQCVLTDGSNENFVIAFEANAERLSDVDLDSSTMYYEAGQFNAVFKAAGEDLDTLTAEVGECGTIRLKVNGHSVTLFPQVDNDDED